MPRIALIRTSAPDLRLTDVNDREKWDRLQAFQLEVTSEVTASEFGNRAELLRALSTGVQNELNKLEKAAARALEAETTGAAAKSRVSDDWLRKYLADRIEQFGRFQLPIEDEKGRTSLSTDSLYVPMTLRIGDRLLTDADETGRALLVLERAAITGDAGAGKSTLLRYLALQASRTRLGTVAAPRSAISDQGAGARPR